MFTPRVRHLALSRLGRFQRLPLRSPFVSQSRSLTFSPGQLGALKRYGFVVNILAGAYIGGLLVCFGLFYMLYNDVNERQHIPLEIGFYNNIAAVKAINKDDVLKSPRYAVKHYRRILIELAKEGNPDFDFDENGPNKYDVPLLDSKVLVYEKSNAFANFYIDIVLRYSKALLAKGELQTSISMLQKVINDDDIFYKLGDAERVSQCCRLLSKVCPDKSDKISYLKRSIDMLTHTYSSIQLDENYLLQGSSRITDELMICLNDLAANYAKASNDNPALLSSSLNIYLSNLKVLTDLRQRLDNNLLSQTQYPLFNCDEINLIMLGCELKAHISEIMWAKGYKKNAIAWGEEVVEEIYFNHSNTKRASPILFNVLGNLLVMYDNLGDLKSKNRCDKLKLELEVFEGEEVGWYDSIISRFSKIMYHKGPLGIIEKPLTERYGRPTRVPEIEEIEDEDEE
ncbi:uncharacterized protein CANTADRAFT_25965 [Suhomyces tanzawaensis NRRL Y-17324]|uniref:Uncharacterized protein n=1 Tax=Suhomyces tanzawaensis NRRL Y-17324 TaxID=984487 RepID=A0A1E4SLI2_9ASCO|nr:uncharacterized protein CANTADRAFT_25965 [Suhomyces tanzawaensis NRRL Y-17324]ODV80373.1 hypothetical protein CANTADRAFT_25965 [Suhomyces tanzawaensis NRRL Y-17324]